MHEAIQPYLLRYEDPLEISEKVTTTRRFLRLGNLAGAQVMSAAESTYRYLRILDDLADEYPFAKEAQKVMQEELDGFLGETPTDLQKCLLEPLGCFSYNRQDAIRNQLSALIRGIMIDLNVRNAQKLLSSNEIRQRNNQALWPPLQLGSLFFLGRSLITTNGTIRLMDAWGRYDNLADLTEDLTHGLNLISSENMERYGFEFRDGELLPNDDLINYYNRERWNVAGALIKNSHSLFRVGLPVYIAALGSIYFLTRAANFRNALKIEEGAIYSIPLDSPVRQESTRSEISRAWRLRH